MSIGAARTRIWLLGFVLLGVARFGIADTEVEQDEELTVEGVIEFLNSKIPSKEARMKATLWVRKLNDPDYFVRAEAERRLRNSPSPPMFELNNATDSEDPEVEMRSKRIIHYVASRSRSDLRNVLRWARDHPTAGFVPPLLALSEYSKGSVERSLIHKALTVASTSVHIPALIECSQSEKVAVRTAAIAGLSALSEAEALDVLAKLTIDKEESVRLAAAVALAEKSDRRALFPLGVLLESKLSASRMRAIHTLRRVTGEEFEFSAYASEESRSKAAKEIQKWIRENTEADLLFEFKDDVYVGRTLMAEWPNSLHHLEVDGTVLFTVGEFKYVWGCHATGDGQFAVVDTRKNKAQVFDGSGREVWLKEGLPGSPSDIKLLENGNRLITISSPSLVIEMNEAKELVWKKEFAENSRATTAERLSNGNTLVNLQFAKKVVEVDAEGEVVWEMGGLDNCLTCQALESGNILVCEMNKGEAVEYDRDGKVVWKLDGFNNACQAQRLPNGNTLVSDSRGIHEYDSDGNKIDHTSVKRGRFWRY